MPRSRRASLIVLCLTAAFLAAGAAAADDQVLRSVSLGISLAPDAALPEGIESPPDHPFWVRVIALWEMVERETGAADWSQVATTVRAARASGQRVVLALQPGGRPVAASSLDAWTAFVRSAVREFAGQVEAIELGAAPDTGEDPAVAAFTLKAGALAVRAEARAAGAAVLVAQSPMNADDMEAQKRLWENDAAAYVDILPVRLRVGDDAADVSAKLLAVLNEAALHPPVATLWAYVEAEPDASPVSVLRGAVKAIASIVPVAFADAPADRDAAATLAQVAAGLHRKIEPGFAPAPQGDLALKTPEGEGRTDFRLLGRFIHETDFRTLVVYEAPTGGTTGGQARLVLDTTDVRDPRVVDPLSGVDVWTGAAPVPGVSKPALRVLLADHPLIVAWDRAAANLPGLDLAPEEREILKTRGLTAEEIIARHQAVQKVQDDRLARWKAKGRLEFHFKFAQGGASLDIAVESNYFWAKGAALEWEQTDYYVNGNLVTWKNIPELPIVQPEKVLTLPLDLTLDRTYAYRLVDEDVVGGRAAYVLAFEPADPNAPRSLYRGRIWIDKETFVRLKQSLIQTNLEPPVVSNEEVDFFDPLTGPDGFEHRLLARQDGQQLWIVAGRNLVVRRQIEFREIEINPAAAAFDEAKTRAYTSKNRMLRDTDEGFRYLERGEDGSRTVKEKEKRAYWFLVGGAIANDAIDGVTPALGVSYLNYNLFGKGQQLNVLFGGVVAFVNYTAPGLFGGRMDLAVEGAGIAIKGDDKVFANGEEVVAEQIQDRNQYLSARMGLPLGSFFKFTMIGDLDIRRYFDSDEGQAARAPGQVFVLPQDHEVFGAAAQLEYNRRGWNVSARYESSWRSEWAPWGLYDTTTESFVDPEYDPSDDRFSTWRLTAFKEWYLPKFQKLRAEIDYLDGSNLDRFSKYAFSQFGDDSLAGFAGTGVRFDRGYIGRGGYSFNLLDVVRLDASAETARTQDDAAGADWQSHTGVGLSANLVGPWKTIISLSYGRAVASDISELEGKQDFLLFVLKLF